MVATLDTHPMVSGAHLFCVSSNSTTSIKVDSFKRPHKCPTTPQTVSNHSVDILDGSYTISNQSIRLAQHCPLNAIENEPFILLVHKHRRQPCRTVQVARSTDNLGTRLRIRHDLNDRNSERRISRVSNYRTIQRL